MEVPMGCKNLGIPQGLTPRLALTEADKADDAMIALLREHQVVA